jgi:long-chain acyl-CoA synthetase
MNDPRAHNYRNVAEAKNIADAFWRRVSAEPDGALYRYAVAPNAQATRVWHSESYRTAAPRIARLAHYLASLGVTQGTPVAILSNSRPEWMLADMAIQTLGGITVSIYQSLPPAEAGFILYDSKATIVFVENDEQAEKIAWLKNNRCPIPERETIAASQEHVQIHTVISFEVVQTLPGVVTVQQIIDDASISQTPPAIPETLTRESIASYVYTSGTTGPPKGVVQAHGNHLANVEQAAESGVFAVGGTMFLYLPLAHSFARLVYYVGFLTSTSLILPAVTDHHTSKLDLSSIARDIREGSATVLPSVPRLFEKMASGVKTLAAGPGLKGKILRLCIRNAQKVQAKREKGLPLGIVEQIIFSGLSGIRRKIREQLFGPHFHHGISGGAKLDPEVNRFFNSLDILICEGYGLTETCVATHVNLPNMYKIGSVGPAFRGVEVQIAESDGEISVRGPNIARGYLNRPQATHEAWSDSGWFRTGDVGRVDEDGFLYITDRKKELVITAGGKKIAPTSIEGMFKRNSFISQAFLVGDGKPYCIMLLTLNEPELRALLHAKGHIVAPSAKLSQAAEVLAMVEEATNRINREVASFETIKRFAILDEDFTVENGLLTPTMKMKRRLIAEKYRVTIDSLYL